MRKQLKKFVATKHNHFGKNEHAFWNGKAWVLNEDESVFFNDRDQASQVSQENGGHGEFVAVTIEF